MEILPLHRYENLTQDCINILNKEWPRSQGARLYSLQKSCDDLPVALAFVELDTVLGFSKIVTVQGQQNSCLFESVIIREEDRGKGYGRKLMEMTERYAKGLGLGLKTAYLNTTDKVGFYSRLGYAKCDPVVSLGANAHRVPESMLKHFTASNGKKTGDLCNDMGKLEVIDQSSPSLPVPHQPTSSCSSPPTATTTEPTPPPPPPPPPPPSSNKTTSIVRVDPSQITWMKKDLCL